MTKVILFLLILFSSVFAADAPNTAQNNLAIEQRLEMIALKRQKLFSDYRAGELLMRNAQLEDAPLKAEEDQLKAMLTAPKSQPPSTPKPVEK